ncbi:MAG: hypothetical protein ACPGVY_17215 [Mycobacterium sp.]
MTRPISEDRTARLKKVAALAVERKSASEIARRLCVSVSTIYEDLRQIRQEWRREFLLSADEHVSDEAKAIQRLEERLQDRLAEIEEEIHGEVAAECGDCGAELSWPRVPVTVREGVAANRAFLDACAMVLRAMERKSKLLGIDAPDEIRLDMDTVRQLVTALVRVTLNRVEDPEVRRQIAADSDMLMANVGANGLGVLGNIVPIDVEAEEVPSGEG